MGLKSLEVEFQVLYSERKQMKETIDLQEEYRNVVSSVKSSLSLNDDHWKDAQMRAQKQMTEHLTCELTREKIRAQVWKRCFSMVTVRACRTRFRLWRRPWQLRRNGRVTQRLVQAQRR